MFTAPNDEVVTSQPGGFQAPAEELVNEKTLAGFGRNVVRDVKDNASGIGNLIGNAIEHPLDTAVSTVKGLPGAVVNEGKRLGVGELLTGHPINAAGKFLDAAYDKPITTASEVIPAAGALGKLGEVGKVLEGGEAGAAAARAAAEAGAEGAEATGAEKAAQAANVAAEGAPAGASEAAGAPKPPPVAEADPLGEVKGYVNRYYENQAKQPGWSNTVAQYLQKESRELAAKEMGAGPRHMQQLGEEGIGSLGQYGMDSGIVDPKVGSIGMKERTIAINKKAGQILGDIRREADSLRDPITQPVDVLQEVRAQLDKKYLSGGTASTERGGYLKALKDLENADATHEGISKAVSEINANANKANKVKQPTNAMTDVANAASRLNNERIKAIVGPEKAAQYEHALREFGATKKIQEFLVNKAKMGMRHGNAGSFTNRMIQTFLEKAGYRAGAKVASGMSKSILENPSTASSLPSMFKEFINQVEELGEEPSGMAYGGVVGVPQDVAQYVTR